jgi:hypothetical protein
LVRKPCKKCGEGDQPRDDQDQAMADLQDSNSIFEDTDPANSAVSTPSTAEGFKFPAFPHPDTAQWNTMREHVEEHKDDNDSQMMGTGGSILGRAFEDSIDDAA